MLKRFSTRRKIGFTQLSDPDSEIIRAFGVLDEEQQPGSFGHGIAHPIIFVVDKNGVVRARFSEGFYMQRPDIDQVLDAVRQLPAAP